MALNMSTDVFLIICRSLHRCEQPVHSSLTFVGGARGRVRRAVCTARGAFASRACGGARNRSGGSARGAAKFRPRFHRRRRRLLVPPGEFLSATVLCYSAQQQRSRDRPSRRSSRSTLRNPARRVASSGLISRSCVHSRVHSHALACARTNSRANFRARVRTHARTPACTRSASCSFAVRTCARSVLPLAVENDISRRAGDARRPRTHREERRRTGAARPRRLRRQRILWGSGSLARIVQPGRTMAISNWMMWGRSLRTGRSRRSACTAKLQLIRDRATKR